MLVPQGDLRKHKKNDEEEKKLGQLQRAGQGPVEQVAAEHVHQECDDHEDEKEKRGRRPEQEVNQAGQTQDGILHYGCSPE